MRQDRHSIAIATTTFYPNFPEQDNIRGRLAMESLAYAKRSGYELLVVDGGSSPDFLNKVRSLGIEVVTQKSKGMSESRRAAIFGCSQKPGVRVVIWVEPEKVDFIRNWVDITANPILNGRADLVISCRNENAISTYPLFQAESEKKADKHWNSL